MIFSGTLERLFNFEISQYISRILESIISINTIYLIIILIGGYFFYIKNKYIPKFTFEKSSEFKLITELAFLSIQGISNILKFLLEFLGRMIRFIILLIIPIYIFNYFFGIRGLSFIVLLIIIFILKIKLMYIMTTVNIAKNNYNYISVFILFEALKQIITCLFKKNTLIKIIIYLTITIIILYINIEIFYIWAAAWIILYFIKTTSYYYIFEIMGKPPQFVSVEYLSGIIEDNLILYDTTSIDYRFKRLNSNDELIIPATSIKNINKNYNIMLDQLDYLLQIEPENLGSIIANNIKSPFFNIAISAIFIPKLNKLKPQAWYNKSVIYSTKNDLDNAKICLEEAVKIDNKYREIAKFDADLGNIKDERWFISIIEEDNILLSDH